MTSLSPERWRRIEPILTEALELEAEARDRFLERACGDDAELLAEIAALLDGEVDAEGLLSRGLGDADATLLREAGRAAEAGGGADSALEATEDEPQYAPGTVLEERFRILAWVGRGGMGEVYRAEDLKLRRHVALFPRLNHPLPFLVLFPLGLALNWTVLLRFGVLSFLTLQAVSLLVQHMPLTPDPSAWYFRSTLVTVGFLLTLAGWGFYHALPRRSPLLVDRNGRINSL